MDMLNLNGADTKLYMRFDKAWHRAAQGMGIFEDRAYILYDTGACAIYDLVTKDPVQAGLLPGAGVSGRPLPQPCQRLHV